MLAADSFRAVAARCGERQGETAGDPVGHGRARDQVRAGAGAARSDAIAGWRPAFVMNGAASIHDFEIGIAGPTSEDVEAVLPDGRFGAAEETGREMNAGDLGGRPRRDRHGRGAGPAVWRCWPRSRALRCSLSSGVSEARSRDGARGDRDGHAAHASGSRRRGDRSGHASRFPAVLRRWCAGWMTEAFM